MYGKSLSEPHEKILQHFFAGNPANFYRICVAVFLSPIVAILLPIDEYMGDLEMKRMYQAPPRRYYLTS